MTSPASPSASPSAPPSASPPAPGVKEIFDRSLVRRHRARAARHFEDFNFLLERCEEEFADQLVGHMANPENDPASVLCLGSHKGSGARILKSIPGFTPALLVEYDLTEKMLEGCEASSLSVAGSDELLPFAAASFDIILAPLTLQFANDLPGAFAQIRRCLKPGGLFLCALFGGDTLIELREAFTRAEIEVDGGLSPRIIPFADIKDFGGLLQRVKFSGVVTDVDKVAVSYGTVTRLMRDLRGMGLTNPMTDRRKTFLKRETLASLEDTYMAQFGTEGQLPASFHILFGMGQAGSKDADD